MNGNNSLFNLIFPQMNPAAAVSTGVAHDEINSLLADDIKSKRKADKKAESLMDFIKKGIPQGLWSTTPNLSQLPLGLQLSQSLPYWDYGINEWEMEEGEYEPALRKRVRELMTSPEKTIYGKALVQLMQESGMPYVKQYERGKDTSKMLDEGGTRAFYSRDLRGRDSYPFRSSPSDYPHDTLGVAIGDVEDILSELPHHEQYSKEFIEKTILESPSISDSVKNLVKEGKIPYQKGKVSVGGTEPTREYFYEGETENLINLRNILEGAVEKERKEGGKEETQYETPGFFEWYAHQVGELQKKDRFKAIIDSLLQNQ